MKHRVVITGIGITGPAGENREIFWKSCLEAVNTAVPIPSHWHGYADFLSRIWAPLPRFDFTKYGLTRTDSFQMDPCQQLAVVVTVQALNQAGFDPVLTDAKKSIYHIPQTDPSRTGIFIGTGAGGITSLISSHSCHILTPLKKQGTNTRFNPFVVSMLMPNGCSSAIGIRFSITGSNRTFCNACSSGTIAIGNAFRAVQDGALDMAICGGAEYLGDQYGSMFRAFDSAKTLVRGESPDANCPFDKRRSGFLLGQAGAAMLILEEESLARSRGATVLAEITAFSERFDAFSSMILDPGGKVIEEMIQEALDEAQIGSSGIDYINAHGTGTIPNDEIEADIIERVFGSRVFVNSTKSITGHTLGACGAIEGAVTALSIFHKKIHPCANLKDPVRNLNFPLQATSFPIQRALTQSFAFGGHDAALILEHYKPG